ncbi:MAG: nylB [Acidimicrobiales bacterium]|nr:nylB [Acidimicrobiales bacterium]
MVQPIPDRPLPPFPAQPDGVAWPTDAWPEADATELDGDSARLADLLEEMVAADVHPRFGRTFAVAVVAGGRLVGERYGRRVVQDLRSLEPDPPYEQVTADDALLSWSMAKSITHLAVGAAVADGRVDVHDPVPEPQWSDPADPRHAITWDDLLTMRSGLAWTEEYYELAGDSLPDVVTMLFGEPAADMAAFAAGFPLVHPPGSPEAFNYSSGTTNIVAANLQRVLGLDAAGMDRFLHDRIFDPIGMRSAREDFDAAGTFIGSSYVFATLRDWCRFGLLAIRGGTWDGAALVPPGWMDHGRAPRSWEDELLYGAQWWTWDRDEVPFGAHGFEGQRVICFPQRDVVVVRLGQSGPDDAVALDAHLEALAACFPPR